MKVIRKLVLPMGLVFFLAVGLLTGVNAKAENTLLEKENAVERHTELSVDNMGELKINRTRVGNNSMGNENSWTLFIYMCGSDLESNYNHASSDIKEMISGSECDNVNIIIQTGGAYRWNKPCIDKDKIGRYIIKKNRLELVESHPDANMGDIKTF